MAFQGFFIMVCVGIYSVLVANIQVSDNVHTALFSVMAYTVILCFSLMKTANLQKVCLMHIKLRKEMIENGFCICTQRSDESKK